MSAPVRPWDVLVQTRFSCLSRCSSGRRRGGLVFVGTPCVLERFRRCASCTSALGGSKPVEEFRAQVLRLGGESVRFFLGVVDPEH